MGILGNFLSCLKSVKDPFGVQEGRGDFSQEAAAEKGLSSRGGENLLVFLELQRVSSRVMTGKLGTSWWGLTEVQSHRESKWAIQDSAAVAAGAKVLIYN